MRNRNSLMNSGRLCTGNFICIVFIIYKYQFLTFCSNGLIDKIKKDDAKWSSGTEYLTEVVPVDAVGDGQRKTFGFFE